MFWGTGAMVQNLLTLLGAIAPLALIVTLWVLAQISRRFGEVTRRPPHYRAFYVAMALMVPPLLTRLLAIGLSADQHAELGANAFEAVLHDLPLALGILLALVTAWWYWGWLIYADEAGTSRQVPRRVAQSTGQTEENAL